MRALAPANFGEAICMVEVFRMLVPKGPLSMGEPDSTLIPSEVKSAKEAVSLGRKLNQAMKPEEAARMYRRALDLAPSDGEALRELALTLFDAGEHAEAVGLFEAFLKTHERDHESRLAFASVLLRMADLERAELELTRCVEGRPKWAEPFVPLVRLLWRRGRPSEARAALDAYRALEPDPRSLEMLETMMRPSR